MIEKIKAHLQGRIEELKEDFHQFLGEKRDRLDPNIEKALFGEKEKILLLVGSSTPFVSQILEHRLNGRDPFEDIQLCKEIIEDLEFSPEDQDHFRQREGVIDEVMILYNILDMPDKVKEVSDLSYMN